MNRALLLFLLGVALIPAASAQNCERRAGNPMDLKIHVSFDDSENTQVNSASESGADIQMDASNHNAATMGGESHDMIANLKITVQLQDSYGTPVHDATPDSSGIVTFRVCSLITYRIRIHGPDIQEYQADDVQPNRGDRIMYVALHRKKSGQNSAANGTIATVRLHIPGKALSQFIKGNQAMQKGDQVAARGFFEKAIAIYPKYDQAYNNLGVILMNSGDLDDGEKAFSKAIELNDRYAGAYVNLAKIAFDRKQYSQAFDLARK